MSDIDWFPLEPGRYLKNTMHLTTRQHGAYWLLIMAAFEARGVLPGTDQGLMAITRLSTKEWREDGDVLKAFLTRDGDRWVHEFAKHQREDAEARVAAKSSAGKKGAHKRWNGRANGSAMAEPSISHRQTDAQIQKQIQEHSSVSTTSTVTPSAADAARQSGAAPRAKLIWDDWTPSEQAVANLRKGRPDLIGALYDERMQDFREWCRAKAVTSHDIEATWSSFMRRTKVPAEPSRKPWDKPQSTGLPPLEPWEKRLRDYRATGFWVAEAWGPKPGERGCRVPADLLRSAA